MSGGRTEALVEVVREDAEGVKVFDLRPQSAMDCLAPSGSHIDLYLPNGMIRQYSLINLRQDGFSIAVRREDGGRGGSVYIHDRLVAGTRIAIGAPRSLFPFAGAPRAVFIAGGIGITPLLTHARHAEAAGVPWALHYSCRNRETAALLSEVLTLKAEAVHGLVQLYFTSDEGGRMNLPEIIGEASAGAHFYICGPDRLTEGAVAAAKGVPPRQLHLESFTNANEIDRSGGFLVVLARSRAEIEVPRGSTLLDALLDAGIEVAHSCCEGTCGTCEVGVVDGIPDHRDVILTDREKMANERMMICCSGSKLPRLVLDL